MARAAQVKALDLLKVLDSGQRAAIAMRRRKEKRARGDGWVMMGDGDGARAPRVSLV
jgi:hypothetical protein